MLVIQTSPAILALFRTLIAAIRSMDYLAYWSLRQRPFIDTENGGFFAGSSQREAIAGLNYFVASDLPSAMLIAPARCGMSSLLRFVHGMRGFGDRATETLLTKESQTSAAATKADLCRQLGYTIIDHDIASQIRCAIETNLRQGVELIWLIDRCSPSAARVAAELIAASPKFRVVIGAATSQIRDRGTEPLQRCAMEIELSPLSIEDTIDYLRVGIDRAGGNRQIFSDNAAVRLHEVTGGRLANLSLAAESALALAARHRMTQVTPAVVEAIDERFGKAA